MKFKHLGGVFLILIIFGYSCTSYKNVPYFQDVRRDTVVNEQIDNSLVLTLQPGDLLGINITSLNHEADLLYNYNLIQQAGALDRTEQAAVVGFLIDAEGYINYPMLGKIKVSGLSTKGVSEQLETKLQPFLSKPVANVRILNFKVSVLGDVKNPGNFNIQNERVTVTEALSLAGDLNITGMRTNILLIRENDGKRQYIPVNLNSKNVLNSPYYYLKNNDVIYVQPNRNKVKFDDATFSKLSLIISALSVLILGLRKY